MKLKIFFLSFFAKRKTRPSYFSAALSEGIKDLFREMGYHSDKKKKE
jgi:hypothetical protein